MKVAWYFHQIWAVLYCWWFSNPAITSEYVGYPIIYKVSSTSQVISRISSSNSSFNKDPMVLVCLNGIWKTNLQIVEAETFLFPNTTKTIQTKWRWRAQKLKSNHPITVTRWAQEPVLSVGAHNSTYDYRGYNPSYPNWLPKYKAICT